MVTSHCSINLGRGRFSRRPQNFVTLNSPCGVLSDSAKGVFGTRHFFVLGLKKVPSKQNRGERLFWDILLKVLRSTSLRVFFKKSQGLEKVLGLENQTPPKQLASSTSKLCILGLTEVKLPNV